MICIVYQIQIFTFKSIGSVAIVPVSSPSFSTSFFSLRKHILHHNFVASNLGDLSQS